MQYEGDIVELSVWYVASNTFKCDHICGFVLAAGLMRYRQFQLCISFYHIVHVMSD